MKTVALKEVCQITNGGTPKSGVDRYWHGGVAWLTPAEMGKRITPHIRKTARTISQEGLANSSAKLVPANSVILSTRAPIGHLAINEVSMAFNQGCRGLTPGNLLEVKYLYYFLYFSREALDGLGTGTTFKELSSSSLANFEIPLASLNDQRRIVAVLDEAFAGIATATENAQKNLTNARALFTGYLETTFNKKGDGWKDIPLGKACKVERGSSPRPIKNFVTTGDDGQNWIKIGDTKNDSKYVTQTQQRITPAGALKSRKVDPGDFILTNSMSFGKPYIMKISGYIHDGWFALRLGEGIDTEYLYYLLSSPIVQKQFQNLAAGAIVLNISGDLVKKAILPIPAVEQQREIVRKIQLVDEETSRLASIYEAKLATLTELKQSLLQKAFAGELT